MSPDQLTPEQQACLALDRNLAVVAGAGSGKTRVLVQRYRKMLVEAGAGVDNILAITFTRKAAAEMLERVRRELMSLQAAPGVGDALKWDRLAEELSRAHISTIHSFCEGLLRQFPIEAAVDPAFEVMEEVDRDFLMAECVERALFDIAQDPSAVEYEPLSRLLSSYSRAELTDMLVKLLEKRHEATGFMSKAASLPFVQFWALLEEKNVQAQQEALERVLADKTLLSALKEISECQASKAGDTGYQLVLQVRGDIARLLTATGARGALEPVHSLVDTFTTREREPRSATRLGAKGNWEPGKLELFRERVAASAGALSRYGEWVSGPLGETDRAAAGFLRDLGKLFHRALEELEQAKGNGRMLDFEDLIQRARNLLLVAPEGLREQLRRRFRYVMVDEFQDADPTQWDLVRLLVGREGGLPPDGVCVLGDPKQSIYGFRSADVRVIQEVRRQFAGKGKDLRETERLLSQNFRSLQMLVDFQNFFFGRLMAAPTGEFEVEYVPMRCARAGKEDPPGRIEILAAGTGKEVGFESTADAVAAEAETVARKISQIMSDPAHLVYAEHDFDGKELKKYVPAQPGHIALLLRNRTHLPAYEAALRKHGIPFAVHAGIGYFQRQEVLDIYNLLSFLADDQKDIALVGALRSPLFGLSDEALYVLCHGREGTLWERLGEFDPATSRPLPSPDDAEVVRLAQRLLARWKLIVDRLSCAELLRVVLDDTGFMGSLGGGIEGNQRRANLDKLLDVIRSFEERGPSHAIGLAGLVTRLQELCKAREREGLAQLELEKSNAVKILTVHAAKGLEFPIVFVPDMASKFKGSQGTLVEVDRDLGVGLRVPHPEGKEGKVDTGLAAAIRRRHGAATLAEEKRLLYVAMTRARDELYLVGRGAVRTSRAGSRDKEEESCWSWVLQHLGLSPAKLAAGTTTFAAPDGSRAWSIPIVAPLGGTPPGAPEPARTPLSVAGVLESKLPPTQAAASTSCAGETLEGLLAQLEFVQEERLYPDFPATALNLYERCPAAFYLQYLLGIREDILACVFQEAEAAAAHRLRERAVMLGTLVHRALEGLIARPAFDEADLRERLREYAWAEYAQAADDEILNHAVRHAAAFTRSEIFQEVTHADEAHSELPFVLKLRSGVIRGQMDLIYRKGSRWHILDYKTSRVDETSGGLRVGKELLWREYRPQVECYAVAASRLFPGCRAGLYVGLYLTGLGQEAGAYFDADKLARAEKELETKAEEIRSLSAESFMAARRPACDSCAYGTARLCQPGKRLWLDARQRSTVRPVTGEAPAG